MATRRGKFAILVLTMAFGWLLRTIPLSYSHVWDEAVYLQDAKVISAGRTNYDELDFRPPLLSILYAGGFKAWDNIYVANLVQGIVTAAVIPCAFLFAEAYFSELAAFLAAILFAFCPYFTGLSHRLLSDAPAVSLMIASLYFLSRSSTVSLYLSGLLFAAASLTRYSSAFLAVYFALWIASSPAKLKETVIIGAGALTGFAPYLAWAQLRYGFFLSPLMMQSRIVTVHDAYNPPSLYFRAIPKMFPAVVLLGATTAIGMLAIRLVGNYRARAYRTDAADDLRQSAARPMKLLFWSITFLVLAVTAMLVCAPQIRPFVLPALIVISVTAIAAMPGSFRTSRAGGEDDPAAARVSEAHRQQLCLLLWGVLYLAFMLTLKHKETRYLLPLVIPVLLLSAVGLDEIFRFFARLGPLWKPAGGAALALAVAIELFPSFSKLDGRWLDDRKWQAVQVSEYLERVSTKNDWVYAVHEVPMLAFYTGRDTKSILRIQESFSRDWHNFMKQRGFYVYFEADARHGLKPEKSFLDTHREFLPIKNFGFATVYRYVPG